jgi:DinB superfamily
MTPQDTTSASVSEELVGCTLRDDQLSDRMRDVTGIFAGCDEFRELPDGYEFRFPGDNEWVRELGAFVRDERTCCGFIQFELISEPNQGPTWLRLRGGEPVKEFVRIRLDAQGQMAKPANGMPREHKEHAMSTTQTDQAMASIPDRESIRAELEGTRNAYHALVNSISTDDWTKETANPGWRVGQILWHLAWGASFFPKGVEECRKGKARNPPTWIMNPLNKLITRIGSRGATPQSVLDRYDANHARILACLDGVQDDEWDKGVKPLGAFGVYKTIESVFHSVTFHFREHEADVLAGLGRRAPSA